MGHVIMNLIVNAAHAIADVIKENDHGSIKISSQNLGDKVEIKVTDSGKGISKEIISKVFDPFFTTKGVGRGTGQGLFIARSTVMDKHNGTLVCESMEGTGSTFIIQLPIESNQGE